MDILDRLRRSVTKGFEPTDEDAIDAATEIERLRKERDELLEANGGLAYLAGENEQLRAALQWIRAQVGNKDAELIRHMCDRALSGKDPANIYVEQ